LALSKLAQIITNKEESGLILAFAVSQRAMHGRLSRHGSAGLRPGARASKSSPNSHAESKTDNDLVFKLG
jgi:hypothetical protein